MHLLDGMMGAVPRPHENEPSRTSYLQFFSYSYRKAQMTDDRVSNNKAVCSNHIRNDTPSLFIKTII